MTCQAFQPFGAMDYPENKFVPLLTLIQPKSKQLTKK